MVGWHEHNDDPDLLRLSEERLGTRFALVRMYQQWQLPNRRVAAMINDGRLVLVSHKPPVGGGWAAVASGAEDGMIRSLASTYKAFGREVLFSFHHEPHDDAIDVKGGTSGTAADYKAAWRRIRAVFDIEKASHSAGGNVFFAYSAVGSWALKAAPGGPPGSGDPLYPGDDLIDVFAHDHYNWYSCRGDKWEEFAPAWASLVRLSAAHAKPLIAAEFGSPPADGLRNDWFRKAGEWLRTDPLARRWMWGFAYFHTLHDTCPWDFLNQGDDGRLGWQDAFRQPYFTGTPFSLASGRGLVQSSLQPPTTGVPATTGTTRTTMTTTTRSTSTSTTSTTTTTLPSTTSTAEPVATTSPPSTTTTTEPPATATAPEPGRGSEMASAPPGVQGGPARQSGRPSTPLLAVGLMALVAAVPLARRVITS
jgi:hypothetical protein